VDQQLSVDGPDLQFGSSPALPVIFFAGNRKNY